MPQLPSAIILSCSSTPLPAPGADTCSPAACPTRSLPLFGCELHVSQALLFPEAFMHLIISSTRKCRAPRQDSYLGWRSCRGQTEGGEVVEQKQKKR